jgi:YVTN family beta-propeller protein
MQADHRRKCVRSTLTLAVIGALLSTAVFAEEATLRLEKKIPLGEVRGRIDHLAVDLKRNRLFVAELENDTVGVVDLNTDKVIQVISGLKNPQGVGYHAATDTLFVANGGDGTVAIIEGGSYRQIARLPLGADADNVRIDAVGGHVVVGYGEGALASIDPVRQIKTQDIKLKAHPESFQIDQVSNRIFVNDPTNEAIAVVDRTSGNQVAAWPTGNGSNFPMALNHEARHVLVAFRKPAKLGAFSMENGAIAANVDLCGDADDMFIDERRQQLYVSCGDGSLDVFDVRQRSYPRKARIATVAGARTSLFVPELDRLFLAVRLTSSERPAIWVFRPTTEKKAE